LGRGAASHAFTLLSLKGRLGGQALSAKKSLAAKKSVQHATRALGLDFVEHLISQIAEYLSCHIKLPSKTATYHIALILQRPAYVHRLERRMEGGGSVAGCA